MNEDAHKPGGLFASVRRILEGGLAILQNRVELFAVELRQEKCRLVEAIIWAAAVVALGIMTLTLLAFSVIILFWEEARVAAVLGLSGLYLLGTLLAWRRLRAKLADPSAFSGTVSEMRKDRECLRSES